MLKVDALVDLFFTDLPFPQRLAKIAACGYRYIETWQGADKALLKEMSDAGRDCGVELISIVMNSPASPSEAPIDPACRQAFLEQIDRYSDNALAAGCARGIVTTGPSIGGKNYQEQRTSLVEALRQAGEMAAKKNFQLNLEPLNTEVDHPGYFLNCPRDGVAIIREVALDNVRLLYDIYHMEIMTGNQTVFIENNIDAIGHFHAAGVPGRHELFNGETNYPFLVEKIEESGYQGFFGLEYIPQLESALSLTQTLAHLSNGASE